MQQLLLARQWYDGKENVIVYDYVDSHIPKFDNDSGDPCLHAFENEGGIGKEVLKRGTVIVLFLSGDRICVPVPLASAKTELLPGTGGTWARVGGKSFVVLYGLT